MSEHTVDIAPGMLHCADCLRTLADVALPRIPGVVSTTIENGGIIVVIDDALVTEDALLTMLKDSGLLR